MNRDGEGWKIAFRASILWMVLAAPWTAAAVEPGDQAPPPDTAGEETLRGLDGDIEKLKEEVLDLNAELFKLQEDLLFPEDSSVVVFVSIEGSRYFQPDSVRLKLDEVTVAGHLYTDREADALRKGGIQRLYVGNVKSGEHQITAFFTGTGPNSSEYKRAKTVTFIKQFGPTYIKLIIRDDETKKEPEYAHEIWE